MSIAVEPRSSDVVELHDGYRAISPLAAASVAAGLLSVLALLDWALGVIPAVGILLGLLGRRSILRRPEELTGLRLAKVGIVLSVLFLVVGWSRLTYVYFTEVPDGYQRLSYQALQPDTSVPGELFPPAARELDGQRVFIKGYVYPGPQTRGIQRFLLCRDNGDCCFGGQPKLTDMISVELKEPLRLDYATRPFAVGGTFRFKPSRSPDGQFAILYHLEADVLR